MKTGIATVSGTSVYYETMGEVKGLGSWKKLALLTTGTDFIIARDGRIAAVYLFFDKLP